MIHSEEELSGLAFLELGHKLNEESLSKVLEVSHIEGVTGVLCNIEHGLSLGGSDLAWFVTISCLVLWVFLESKTGTLDVWSKVLTKGENVSLGRNVGGSEKHGK